MKSIYVTFVLFFLLFHVLGQVPDRAMLFEKLKSVEKDSAKAVILNTIARTYVRKQPDSAIIYFNKALDFSSEQKNPLFLVNTKCFMSMTYSIWGKQDSARHALELAAEICKKQGLDSALHQVYFGLGNVVESQGNFTEALKYYLLALDYFEKNSFLKSLNRARAGISYIYLKTEEYGKARDLIHKSNKYYKSVGADRQLMNGYSRLGTLFEKTNRTDSAIFYFEKAKEIATTINAEFSLAQLYLNLGNTLLNASRFEGAQQNFEKALAMMRKNKAEPGDLLKVYVSLMFCNEVLAYKYNENAFQDSVRNLLKIVEEPIDLKNAYELLSKVDSAKGNYASALQNYKRFQAKKDSLFNEKISEQLLDIETRYETEKLSAEKNLAQKRAALAESESQRNLILFLGSLIVGILIIITLIFYYSRLKQRRKAELIALELKESQKRLSLEKQYRDSELKALKAQMNPHFIFNVLNSIQEFIVLNEKDLAAEYLATFAELIRSYLHYSNQGHITIAEEIDALDKYMQLESLRFEDKMKYEIRADREILSDFKIPTMVIQPYVENAIKHGLFNKEGSQQLVVELRKVENNSLEVSIKDNGIGRDKAKELKQRRSRSHAPFALEATSNRLELLNQKFDNKIGLKMIDLKDEAGKATGTEVIITIPILN